MMALLQTGDEGTRAALRFLDLPAAWVIVLVILPLFGLVTWIGYGRESLSTSMRAALSTMRIAAFLLLFLVLARPVMVERREEVFPAEVLVLLDDSASMRRKDAYSGDLEIRNGLERATGLTAAGSTRLDLARGALEKELLPVLEAREYVPKLFAFSESATPIGDLSTTEGRGPGTHLGDAIHQALATHRGRHVTDIVVVSDGRSNGGIAPIEAARAVGAAGIPIHTLVVGDTRPERNAVIELIEAPGEALQGDELAVTVRVLGRGIDLGTETTVALEELETETGGDRIVAEERVQLTEEGRRVVLVAPEANRYTGERRFRVSLPQLEGETMVDDNRIEFLVHVSPAVMRVLYVEGYPRWEYRFVKNLLLRADENILAQCYLLSATRDFPQESSRDMPPLTRVPTTREELLDNYDVVILGDVDPIQIASDSAQGALFIESLREFVEAGGGLLFQAGEYHNPRALRSTELEDVLPVVLDPIGALGFQGDTRQEFRPILEDPLQPHEILRLHPDPEVTRLLWEDPEDGLRGFYWYLPVQKEKPGTEVLLRHPEDRSVQTGDNVPLLVAGHFPAGRTLFLALDSTYRWRYHYGDRYLETFWRNAIRWLALGRLKSGDRRYRLETTRSSYDLEDRVVFEARVLDEDFRPSTKPAQKIFWSGPEGTPDELELPLVKDRPGVYRGGLLVDRPGIYRAWIEAEVRQGLEMRRQRVSPTEFEVLLPSRENADPSPDPEALALLASKTGGRSLDLANVRRLAEEFPGDEERREPISSRLEDAWDNWSTLLVALGLLSAEWILRKRAELV